MKCILVQVNQLPLELDVSSAELEKYQELHTIENLYGHSKVELAVLSKMNLSSRPNRLDYVSYNPPLVSGIIPYTDFLLVRKENDLYVSLTKHDIMKLRKLYGKESINEISMLFAQES